MVFAYEGSATPPTFLEPSLLVLFYYQNTCSYRFKGTAMRCSWLSLTLWGRCGTMKLLLRFGLFEQGGYPI